MTNLQKATVLQDVLTRLGYSRACEAGTPNMGVIPGQFEGVESEGYPIVGVDPVGRKFRSRIRVCDALSGDDVRITLARTDDLDYAAYAYRVAHVALWGSASWAACDDLMDSIASVRK